MCVWRREEKLRKYSRGRLREGLSSLFSNVLASNGRNWKKAWEMREHTHKYSQNISNCAQESEWFRVSACR